MAELVAERLLGVRRDDDQRLLCFTARTFTLRLHHIKTSLWLDTFDAFCLNYSFWSDHLSTFCLNRILGFGRETTSFCNRVLWLAAYPEGALGDADSSPGDGHGVFERGVGRVGAGVQPVTFTPHLHVHWDSISILTDRQTDRQEVCQHVMKKYTKVQMWQHANVCLEDEGTRERLHCKYGQRPVTGTWELL